MKLIFTSCIDAERVPNQPIWDEIRKRAPEVLMLLGDQIYMDWGIFTRRNWRQATDKGEEGLKDFADVMHRRYARQWNVPEFQRLITGMALRDPSHLLLTWDDHDFAWNNSWGGEPTEAVRGDGSRQDKHHVPDEVKRISHALFRQFENVLRNAAMGEDYPDAPTLEAMLTLPGDEITWNGFLGSGRVECLLLDTRWNRQGRVPGGYEVALLSQKTRNLLITKASQPEGLLVVAGGTPMWHKGLLSHDAWCSEMEAGRQGNLPAYVEYGQLLIAAKRPVLYLSGDIHRNAFSGRLRTAAINGPSQVLQILSSGAALGRTGPKKFPPCFCELDLPDSPKSGQVTGSLYRSAPTTPASFEGRSLAGLAFSSSSWSADWQGVASAEDPTPDSAPLDLLIARAPKRSRWKHADKLSTLFEESDDLFESEPLIEKSNAEPFRMRATGFREGEPEVEIARLGTNAVAQMMAELFATARARQGPAIFFVHGFGKSLPDAAGQGYQLRETYGCAPLVYAWEAGRSGGFLKTFTGISQALRSAELGGYALSTALSHFNAQAGLNPDVTSVVLARSTGALALGAALFIDGINRERQLNHVTRVVLSAPFISQRDWNHRLSFADLIPQVVLTRNRNDETLRTAKWVDNESSIMGWDGTFSPNRPEDVCLDFSDAPGVFDLHDYLLYEVSPQQRAVNQALLREKVFTPAHMKNLLSPLGPERGVWGFHT